MQPQYLQLGELGSAHQSAHNTLGLETPWRAGFLWGKPGSFVPVPNINFV